MTLIRSYLAVLLAVLLGFSAYGEASVQAMQDATGRMVICTGAGPVTVYVDEAGQPAAPPHPCPDCISLALDAGIGDRSGLAPVLSAFTPAPSRAYLMRRVPAPAAPKARAPPASA